jgi:hypothetical protein
MGTSQWGKGKTHSRRRKEAKEDIKAKQKRRGRGALWGNMAWSLLTLVFPHC